MCSSKSTEPEYGDVPTEILALDMWLLNTPFVQKWCIAHHLVFPFKGLKYEHLELAARYVGYYGSEFV